MRLSQKEIRAIIESFNKIFKSGKIYLFGSRVDNKKRGGDIDLFIQTDNRDNLMRKKIEFLVFPFKGGKDWGRKPGKELGIG